MKNHLFIPYEPTQAEILKLGRVATLRDFRKLAKTSSAKCALLVFDTREDSGLKLLFTCGDGEISGPDGAFVEALPRDEQ